MSILFGKVLAVLAMPLGLTLALVLIGVMASWFGWRRLGQGAILVAAAALWVLSTPITARALAWHLEKPFPLKKVEDLPSSDAVIVLGGFVSPPGADNPYADLQDSADRLFHALRIYRAGKAKYIVISGGNVFATQDLTVEADAAAAELVGLGVPPDAILRERTSRNTFENAQGTAGIWEKMGFASGLLVTSASHMSRALAVFRKAGLAVEPAPTDPLFAGELPPFPLPFLPSAASLGTSTRCLWELAGIWTYRLRGWA